MKVLVIGVGGQVGSKVAKLALQNGDTVVGAYRSRPLVHPGIESIPLDKADPHSVTEGIERIRPDVVIDTGALHNVDYCEMHPDEAKAVNSVGTGRLARAAWDVGARFVFISTDYVFDGAQPEPYSESDSPHPQSIYARSKLEGEQVAMAVNRNTVIARPSVIYSWAPLKDSANSASGKPLNFASWFLRQLLDGKEVRIVTDQVASPTLADDLAGALLALARSSATGVFHTAGATPLSRYDFCIRIAHHFGLQSQRVVPVESAVLQQAARRPHNSSLSSDKLRRETGYAMQEIGPALNQMSRGMEQDPELPPLLRNRDPKGATTG